jgi:hypothetical protein
VAGKFCFDTPHVPHLEETGRLCAWLAQNLGLAPEYIFGMSELTKRGDSPGASFYRTGGWKPLIVRQVQLHLAALNANNEDPRPDEILSHQLADVQQQLEKLRNELAPTQAERDRLRIFNERLQIDATELRRELEMQPEGSGQRLRIQNLVDKLPRDPTGAGRSVRYTFSPVCNPTPVARITFFSVRCRTALAILPIPVCAHASKALAAQVWHALTNLLRFVSRRTRRTSQRGVQPHLG